jgi:hypothetical protein
LTIACTGEPQARAKDGLAGCRQPDLDHVLAAHTVAA